MEATLFMASLEEEAGTSSSLLLLRWLLSLYFTIQDGSFYISSSSFSASGIHRRWMIKPPLIGKENYSEGLFFSYSSSPSHLFHFRKRLRRLSSSFASIASQKLFQNVALFRNIRT